MPEKDNAVRDLSWFLVVCTVVCILVPILGLAYMGRLPFTESGNLYRDQQAREERERKKAENQDRAAHLGLSTQYFKDTRNGKCFAYWCVYGDNGRFPAIAGPVSCEDVRGFLEKGIVPCN